MAAVFSNNVTTEMGADFVRFVFNDERAAIGEGLPKSITTVGEVVLTHATAKGLFETYEKLLEGWVKRGTGI